jgi:SAM-dependent methyltransferase
VSAALPHSEAAERNKAPILEVLRLHLPPTGRVLEIASGTGQHVLHFAAALPALHWQPSDPAADRLETIRARCRAAGLGNVGAPLPLDVCATPWPLVGDVDAVVCINMIHIAPEAATPALLRGARAALRPGAGRPLVLYGPFREDGRHTAESNAAFDCALRAQDPSWGVRDLGEVTVLASTLGLERQVVLRLPANNLAVVFRSAD